MFSEDESQKELIHGYRLEKELAEGGFGRVFECTRIDDGKVFALKKLRFTNADAVGRFKREIEILGKLKHANIIEIVDSFVEDESYGYVMPMYATSLKEDLWRFQGKPCEISTVFEAILNGMRFAHESEAIHRDLNPANILLDLNGAIVISDFGLGRFLNSASVRKTETGDTLGTAAYMAPEQFSGAANAGKQADIYALGRILLALYEGDLESPTHNPTSNLDADVRQIIEKCCQQNEKDRFQSISELQSAWKSVSDRYAALSKHTPSNSTSMANALDTKYDDIANQLATSFGASATDAERKRLKAQKIEQEQAQWRAELNRQMNEGGKPFFEELQTLFSKITSRHNESNGQKFRCQIGFDYLDISYGGADLFVRFRYDNKRDDGTNPCIDVYFGKSGSGVGNKQAICTLYVMPQSGNQLVWVLRASGAQCVGNNAELAKTLLNWFETQNAKLTVRGPYRPLSRTWTNL
jgi:serine/threonine protein kinase